MIIESLLADMVPTLTCILRRNVWAQCRCRAIWTPEANCPLPCRLGPGGFSPGAPGSEVVPSWNKVAHHLLERRKEREWRSDYKKAWKRWRAVEHKIQWCSNPCEQTHKTIPPNRRKWGVIKCYFHFSSTLIEGQWKSLPNITGNKLLLQKQLTLLFHLKCAGSSICNCKKLKSNLWSRGSENERFHTFRSVKDKTETGRLREGARWNRQKSRYEGGNVIIYGCMQVGGRNKEATRGVWAALENTKFPSLKPLSLTGWVMHCASLHLSL